MKNLLIFLVLLVSTTLSAISPTTTPSSMLDYFESSSDAIDTELNTLHEINQLVLTKSYDFKSLTTNHSELVASANLSHKAEAGIFDGHPDNPAGIPGFWWGFCCGLIGMVVIYLTMDEGEGRKEQVKNSLYGCLVASAISIALQLIAAAAGS